MGTSCMFVHLSVSLSIRNTFGVPSSVISAEMYFAGFCARAYVAVEGSLGQTALQVLGVPVHDGTRGTE